ncbi:hypothetical protein IL992_27870 [Microbispora sp. NEAU-D428]|nr:hypothetical protein [Microbispora sitophila]MBE3012972.1 hypothetical protein [Microbispora sitophila]
MLAAWLLDVATPADRDPIFGTAPAIMWILYRLSWRRSYERRVSHVYE